MNRRRILGLVAAVFLSVGATAAITVAVHDPAPSSRGSAGPGSGDPSRLAATPTTTAATPEEAFLAVTAAHLCGVQSTVYPDASALAAAYAQVPDYPDLAVADVAAFRQRLTTDAAFSAAFNEILTETCRPQPAPGS